MRAIKTGDQSKKLKKAISRVNLEPLPGSQPERRLLYIRSMRAERCGSSMSREERLRVLEAEGKKLREERDKIEEESRKRTLDIDLRLTEISHAKLQIHVQENKQKQRRERPWILSDDRLDKNENVTCDVCNGNINSLRNSPFYPRSQRAWFYAEYGEKIINPALLPDRDLYWRVPALTVKKICGWCLEGYVRKELKKIDRQQKKEAVQRLSGSSLPIPTMTPGQKAAETRRKNRVPRRVIQ
jgi:hypothetical protein